VFKLIPTHCERTYPVRCV